MIPCPVCHNPTKDGLLCTACTAALRAALRDLPELMRELRTNLCRLNQAGTGNGRVGRETPMPFDVNASEVAYVVVNTIGTWIRDIDEDADPGHTMTLWCAWLLERMPQIRAHLAVEHIHDEVTYSVRIVRQAIDRPASRQPEPYEIELLRTQHLPMNDLHTAVQALTGATLNRKTLRSWIARGRLNPADWRFDGEALYAVDEALALAAHIAHTPDSVPCRA